MHSSLKHSNFLKCPKYRTTQSSADTFYPLLKTLKLPPGTLFKAHARLLLCFKFFLPLHCPLSGGLGPNHIYKNLPRLYYPRLKTHPRTPHFHSSFPPERFLRPHPRLLLCFNFFLPLQSPPLRRPRASLCIYVAGLYYPLLKTYPSDSATLGDHTRNT